MQIEQRLEMIEKMREQEMSGQNRLYQMSSENRYHPKSNFVHHTQYSPYHSERYDLIDNPRENRYSFWSFKIRILLAIVFFGFLFSLKGSAQEEVVQRAVKHLSDYPTIESVTDACIKKSLFEK